jgi:hypothetical protein
VPVRRMKKRSYRKWHNRVYRQIHRLYCKYMYKIDVEGYLCQRRPLLPTTKVFLGFLAIMGIMLVFGPLLFPDIFTWQPYTILLIVVTAVTWTFFDQCEDPQWERLVDENNQPYRVETPNDRNDRWRPTVYP